MNGDLRTSAAARNLRYRARTQQEKRRRARLRQAGRRTPKKGADKKSRLEAGATKWQTAGPSRLGVNAEAGRYKMRVRNPSKEAQLDKGGFCSAAVPAAVRGNYKTSTHGQLRSPALLGLSRMYCVIFRRED